MHRTVLRTHRLEVHGPLGTPGQKGAAIAVELPPVWGQIGELSAQGMDQATEIEGAPCLAEWGGCVAAPRPDAASRAVLAA
jgi:hypothetical protein